MTVQSLDVGVVASPDRGAGIAPGRSPFARVDWLALILLLLALAHALWRLDVAPALWHDEGWHMMIARTWVEQGHYGRLLLGQPSGPGILSGFPLVASVALSFRLLGVGVWQGRIVVVVYTLGALLLLYHLARRLYRRGVATGTLAVALLMIPYLPQLHPLWLGRMVFAESPMFFFLLAGYASFLLTLEKSAWFLPLTLVCWAVALDTKLQLLPFWVVSLGTALLTALFRRQRRMAGLIAAALVGSLVAWRFLSWLWALWLGSGTVGTAGLGDLIGAAALVSALRARLAALRVVAFAGLGVMLGLGSEVWKAVRGRNQDASSTNVVRWALVAFTGSWLAWYLLLSVGWPRYLAPVLFVGSMFAAALLHDLSGGFDWFSTIQRAAHALTRRPSCGRALHELLAIFLITWAVSLAAYSFRLAGIPKVDTSIQDVVDFLNAQTEPNAVIEAPTYELHFLLDRPYHYPPDELTAGFVQAMTLQHMVPIDYDPLTADPDYLVVNWDFVTWIAYDEVLKSGAFRSLCSFGPYEIYERVR